MNTPIILVDLVQAGFGRQRWRWVARNAGNQKILARSSERYTNESDCRKAIDQVFGPNVNVFLRQPERGNVALRRATDA